MHYFLLLLHIGTFSREMHISTVYGKYLCAVMALRLQSAGGCTSSVSPRLVRVSRLLPRLRIRVSIASLFVSMAAAWEKRVPKRYSDEIFSTGLLFRKKTRTINDRNRLYPVVVTAVNKVEK